MLLKITVIVYKKRDQCNTWENYYGHPIPNSGTDSNGQESCSNVHTSIFGNIDGDPATVQDFEKIYYYDIPQQKDLAKYNIIDRDICEKID